MLVKYWNRETISYLIFGVLTTGVDYLVYHLLRLNHVPLILRQTIAWSAAVIFAFITNKFYVFQSRQMQGVALCREFISFVAARIVSLIFTLVGLWLFADVLGVDDWLIKNMLAVAVIILNYLFSKWFIFKPKDEVKFIEGVILDEDGKDEK